VEVSQVRKRVQGAIAAARTQAQQRRQQTADAERAYETFLQEVATPLARQVANTLKTEGYAFTLFTPAGALRLAADRGRDDFVELALDAEREPPQVVGRIRHTRGSRTVDEERPIKAGASPEDLTEEDVLEFFMSALERWLS